MPTLGHTEMKRANVASEPTWLEIAVEVAAIDTDVAADILRQACPGGVAIQSASRYELDSDSYVADGDALALVCGYLPAGQDSERLRRSLRPAMRAAPLEHPPRWRRVRRLREESWSDSWKKHFGVQRHGRALVVKPSWTRYRLKGGDIVIEIDPGMAFGTGQHPTTAMCLRALEEQLLKGADVLDLGCGSGILAKCRTRDARQRCGQRRRRRGWGARGDARGRGRAVRCDRREHQRAYIGEARSRPRALTETRRVANHERISRRCGRGSLERLGRDRPDDSKGYRRRRVAGHNRPNLTTVTFRVTLKV